MFDSNKSISLEIILDDDFSGMMYGLPEESTGCKLKGKVVLNNKNTTTAKQLSFIFVGKIVAECGPPMSSSRPEYSEIKTLYRKECVFHNSETSHKKIPAGTHEYYFDFDLPGYLPSSFKGTRGKIEYYCSASLVRPSFLVCKDITIKKTVNIKRCIMDETRAEETHRTAFNEGFLDEKISYQINTPIMAFREGGAVEIELKLRSLDSGTVVEDIECGLKEQIHYHTTGEEPMSVIANVTEDRYPLGKKRIKCEQNAINGNPISFHFRLCPWVNYDVNSQLINIHHKLSFTICVSKIFINVENDEGENLRNPRPFSEFIPSVPSSREVRPVSRLPNPRRISLSSIINSQRASLMTKVKKKYLNFDVPIIVTAKSSGQRQQSFFVDRPPAYAIASMVPPPPEYADELSNDNTSDGYIEYDM